MSEAADATLKFSSVYISYSRRDESFMRTLYQGLLDQGMTPDDIWIDWEDASLDGPWEDEVKQALSSVDTFIFVITPDALDSEVCLSEIRLAEEAKIKFVPIFHADMRKGQHIPSVVSHANWVYMRDDIDDFSVVFPALIDTINTDLEYVEKHVRYQSRADEWITNELHKDFLVEGDELVEGERWLATAMEHGEPKPTPDQAEYFLTSREHDTKMKRRRNRIVAGLLAGALLGLCVALFFWQAAQVAKADADEKRDIAYVESTRAEEKATEANIARETAEADRAIAQTQEYLAEVAATEESIALADAQTQQAVALTQEGIANRESTAAAAAAQTALAAVETAQAESFARATQKAIAEAEANERATQQALAELEADQRATQQAIAEKQEAAALVSQAQAMQDAAEARARALAAAAMTLKDSDPQLARLLALLSYQETRATLSEPLAETKTALDTLARHPLYYIWDVPSTVKFIETRKDPFGMTQLLVYPGTAGTTSIDIYDYDTRTLIDSITLGFVPEEIKLSPGGNILMSFIGNDTAGRIELIDMTSAAFASQTIADTYPTTIVPHIIYPSTAVKSDAATLNKLTDADINQGGNLLIALSNNFTVTIWDLSGFPGSAPTKILEADVFDQTDKDYTNGALPGAPWLGWHHVVEAHAIAFRPSDDDYFVIGSFGNYNGDPATSLSGKEHEWKWDGVLSPFHTGATLSARRNQFLMYPIGMSEILYSSDGSYVIGNSNSLLTYWDRQATIPGEMNTGHSGTIVELSYSPSQSYLISAGKSGAVSLWEYDSFGGSLSPALNYAEYPSGLKDGVIHGGDELFAVADTNGDIAFLTRTANSAFTWSAQIIKLEGEVVRSMTLTAGECALYGASICTFTASIEGALVAQAEPAVPQFYALFFIIVFGGVFVQAAWEYKSDE